MSSSFKNIPRTLSAISAFLFISVVVFAFQNCGQVPAACSSEEGSPTTDCNSLSSLSTDAEEGDSSLDDSPFSGSDNTGNTAPSGDFSSRESTQSSSGGTVNGSQLARNCTSSGCPASAGFAFQYLPTAITVEEGQPAYLSATAVNPSGASVSYQWYKNGNAIPGKTGSQLAFYPSVLADAGNYMVKAYDKSASGSILKTISTSPVTVTIKELIIDCKPTTYAWYSKPMQDYVYGDVAKYDPWNPTSTTKLMNPVYSSYPNYAVAPKSEDTLAYNLPSKVNDGAMYAISCAEIRSNAPKPADRLGIPGACQSYYSGEDYGYVTRQMQGTTKWQCLNGRFQYVSHDCACVTVEP